MKLVLEETLLKRIAFMNLGGGVKFNSYYGYLYTHNGNLTAIEPWEFVDDLTVHYWCAYEFKCSYISHLAVNTVAPVAIAVCTL